MVNATHPSLPASPVHLHSLSLFVSVYILFSLTVHAHTHPRQAPTYHIVIEVVLGLWVLYLLFFSKQYRPKSKHDKLTKEVCSMQHYAERVCHNYREGGGLKVFGSFQIHTFSQSVCVGDLLWSSCLSLTGGGGANS